MEITQFNDDVRAQLAKVLQSPDGQFVLRCMELLYDEDAIADISSENLTYFRLGRREVYREMRHYATPTREDEDTDG